MSYRSVHRPLTRIVAAALACILWVSTTADAFGLDPCPHHGVPALAHGALADAASPSHHAMEHGAMDHGAMDHGAMDHGAAHTTTPAAGHDASHSHHGDHSHGICTCMGACAAAAAVHAPVAIQLPFFLDPVRTADAIHTIDSPRARAILDMLPYGIAPPAATRNT